MGIEVRKRWLATLDSRTRPSHRQLDGEVADVNGTFPNGCRYPGDPQGPAAEVWNCRCTLVPDLDGYDAMASGRYDKSLKGISYEDWKAGKKAPEPKQGSGRSFSEFASMPSIKNQLDRFDITADQYTDAARDTMREYGMDDLRQFGTLTKTDQREIGKDALDAAIVRQVDAPVSKHALGRMKERGVKPSQVNDALRNPIYLGPVETDADGRHSRKKIGREATVAINTDTQVIITSYPTKKSNRKKYGGEA